MPQPAISAAPPAKPAAATTARQGVYRIGAGDTVSITVYQEPDLSVPAAKVGPDGIIALQDRIQNESVKDRLAARPAPIVVGQ